MSNSDKFAAFFEFLHFCEDTGRPLKRKLDLLVSNYADINKGFVMATSWKTSLRNILLVTISLVCGMVAVEGFNRIFSNDTNDQALNITDRAAESEFSND